MGEHDLLPDEITSILNVARMAKINGYSGFSGKFFEHRLSLCRVELDTPRTQLEAIYKKSLTGTSSLR